MKFHLEAEEIRPVVEVVVAEVLRQAEADRAKLNGRLAYGEAEAAALLGIARHQLRDARLRGEIPASKIGKNVIYQRNDLIDLLTRNRLPN